MTLPVLFLDFDGVLNNMEYLIGIESRHTYVTGKRSHDPMLDPLRIERVNRIVERTGCSVVLHTSWRLGFSREELNGMLQRRDARFHAVGVAPRRAPTLSDGEMRIADCIREWLRRHGEDVPRYVVLDDGVSADLGDGSFVHVPQGIEDEHVERAVEVLGVECATRRAAFDAYRRAAGRNYTMCYEDFVQHCEDEGLRLETREDLEAWRRMVLDGEEG